jgi:type I restriction enzyme S subunit
MGVENNIPESWVETTLGEISKVQTGPFGSQLKNEQYITGGTPVITVEHIKDFRISDFDYPSVTNEDRDRLSKYLLKEGDIVFTRVGSVDLSAYVSKKQDGWMFSSRMLNVRPTNQIDSKYISYFFRQPLFRSYIFRISVGATMPSINTGILKSIPISYPPLPEQKAIAQVLTAFDDKIELLQAQNKTLEAMAQTIFKEWFGKYQIGDELPEGWKEDSLDNIALEITRGFTTSYVEKSNIINLNQKVNKGKKLDKQHFKYYPVDTIVPGNKFIKKYDILLNSLGQGTLGRVHLYKENTKNVVADQHVSILRFNNDLSYYVYQILASKSGQYRLENEITGSTGMLMLNIGRVRDFKIIVPTKEKLELFKKSLDPIYGKVEINNSQIQSLTKTRDTLLPKLMSGQVRVNNIKNT